MSDTFLDITEHPVAVEITETVIVLELSNVYFSSEAISGDGGLFGEAANKVLDGGTLGTSNNDTFDGGTL